MRATHASVRLRHRPCAGRALRVLLVALPLLLPAAACSSGAPDRADTTADSGPDARMSDASGDAAWEVRGSDLPDSGPDAPVTDTAPDRAAADGGPLFQPLACDDQAGTAMTLAQKAEAMDHAAVTWHLPEGQDLLFSVHLKEDLQTFDKVGMSDNVGTWTAFYAASQSFRYAATRDPEALANLRRVIRGEHDMLEITGVPGLFTRVIVNPALPGFPSADQLAVWYPDCDLSVKHCKKFIEVTEGPYKGLWFKNDVSKDEYAAHMFSMAVAWELVDDPEVRERVADIVTQVGDHLIDHALNITDVDGKVTTFGAMNAAGFDDWPGFDAVLSLSWLRLATTVGGDKYRDFYENCLLQKSGKKACIPGEEPKPYTVYIKDMVGLDLGCKTNWNNHNMAQLSMYHLVRNEDDPEIKALYRDALAHQLWAPTDPYPMRDQQKTLYTFFYLVNRDPSDPWPSVPAHDAICTMKRFRETKNHFPVDTTTQYPTVCLDRNDEPMTDVVIPIDMQAMDNCLWLGNPYKPEVDPGDPKIVESPEDYLTAYWMGRYFGFITPEM